MMTTNREVNAVAGMKSRYFANILHGQLQAALITEDSPMPAPW